MHVRDQIHVPSEHHVQIADSIGKRDVVLSDQSRMAAHMRWKFIDPKNRTEAAERAATIGKIDSWWQEFRSKRDNIAALFSRKTKWDLPAWMGCYLQGIHPRLMWEYGPAVVGKGHRLVITPESAHYLRPLVRTILERAPALDGWEYYEYRLGGDLESARQSVQGRTGVDINSFRVMVSLGKQRQIDLKFASPSMTDQEDRSCFNAAFVATESLLGEQCLNRWIGAIEATPMPRMSGLKSLLTQGKRQQARFLGLDILKNTVDALIGSVREQLPSTPHCEWVDQAEWTIWELKPKKAGDYFAQDDLLVGRSANPAQWTAARGRGLFSSERFSRCGEMFCYVKIDGSEGLGDEGFADKSEIEDALDAVLKPDKLGCNIGGGTGLRYLYIDLALSDVERGIEAIRRRLREGRVPKRSWILFCDSDLAVEWIGVYDDSPPPPMSEHTPVK